jgi:coproporphyrinogen III oxidase-like Fe-S oxidoreductase
VSFYGLTIEEGTEFGRLKAAGLLALPADGTYNGMYLAGAERMERAGYVRYEVSNFGRPGKECLHNQGYWRGAEYLGFGPGAHSYHAGRRTVSPRTFEGYLAWGGGGFARDGGTEETLTPDNLVTEAVLLGLRQGEGLDLDGLRARFGFAVPEAVLAKWHGAGLRARDPGRVRLAGEGWLFLDEIGADLLARGQAAA